MQQVGAPIYGRLERGILRYLMDIEAAIALVLIVGTPGEAEDEGVVCQGSPAPPLLEMNGPWCKLGPVVRGL